MKYLLLVVLVSCGNGGGLPDDPGVQCMARGGEWRAVGTHEISGVVATGKYPGVIAATSVDYTCVEARPRQKRP